MDTAQSTCLLTSTPKSLRTGKVRSQSSEARSRTSMHGNVYQPNEELFKRGRPNLYQNGKLCKMFINFLPCFRKFHKH